MRWFIRTWSLLVLALLVVVGVSRAAWAEVGADPVGWEPAGERTRALASARAWIEGSEGIELLAVRTTAERDAFAEVLALYELPGALDTRAPIEAELGRACSVLVPCAAATPEVRTREREGLQLVEATWAHDDVSYRMLLAPSGPTRVVMLMAVLTHELPLYRDAFDEAAAGLEGLAPPVEPFAHRRAQRWVVIGWLVLAGAMLGLGLWLRPFDARAVDVGRVSALVCIVGAVASMWWTGARLRGEEESLRLAGLTREGVSAEFAAYGVVVGVLCWLVGTLRQRAERPIASAPSHGAFTDRHAVVPVGPNVPGLPVVPGGHPDGRGNLHPLTTPPGALESVREPIID